MKKKSFLYLLFFFCGILLAQETICAYSVPNLATNDSIGSGLSSHGKNHWVDSTDSVLLAAEQFYQLPIISSEGLDQVMEKQTELPALLHANKDPFLNFALFQFSVNRFKFRALPNRSSVTCINGLELMNLFDGNPSWNVLNGITELTRNSEMRFGLGTDDLGLDQQGVKQLLDLRPHKMLAQQTLRIRFHPYAGQQKYTYAKVKGFNQAGWAIAYSAAMTIHPIGYGTGNLVNGISGMLAIDKQWANHLFTLVFFENGSLSIRQAPIVSELSFLNQGKLYNPNMGMNNGIHRNINLSGSRMPVILLSDEVKLPNQSHLWVSLAWMGGNRFTTGIDYYDASNPSPDYYQYLPSFQKDSTLQALVRAEWENNPMVGQINWKKLISINQQSLDSVPNANGINGFTEKGLRAKYIIEKRMIYQQQIHFKVNWQYPMPPRSILKLGLNFQWQEEIRTKKIADLLGAAFYVNWNGFAKRDVAADQDIIQNNLDIPNEILRKDDLYGYRYTMRAMQNRYWLLYQHSLPFLDYFLQASITQTNYQRIGLWRNGLFPFESLGPSQKKQFLAHSIKAGLTLKLNGKNYLFLAASEGSMAPLANDIFLSPKLHNLFTEDLQLEKNRAIEIGYFLQQKQIQIRATAYWSQTNHATDLLSFYHDRYQTMVNLSLSGIGKKQMGLELGAQWNLNQWLQCQLGLAIGEAIYSTRQQLQVNADNGMAILEKALVYVKNYRQGGMPQAAAGLGFSYRSADGKWMGNLASSFFDQHWISINPIRRTANAISNQPMAALLQNEILQQEKLPFQWNVNLGLGYRFSLFQKKSLPANFQMYLSIQNLFNQQDFMSTGFEQLRFDFQHQSTEKFPSKYYYAPGIHGSISCLIRFKTF